MKNLYKVLVSTLFIATFGFAQTDVSGSISSNTTWDASGSPYTIIANTVIMDGVILSISSGVTVIFGEDLYLKVLTGGTLIAQGTENDSINFSFTGNSTEGIQFASGSVGSTVQYYNDYVSYISGSIFNYCSFNNINGVVIDYQSTHVLIKNSLFNNNQGNTGIIKADYNDIIIDSSKFSNNSSTGSGGVIYKNNSSSNVGQIKIYNSIFVNNSSSDMGGVVYVDRSSGAIIVNCIFDNNETVGKGGAIYYSPGSSSANANFTNCVFKNNSSTGYGGAVWISTVDEEFEGCTFINNQSSSSGGAIAKINYNSSQDLTLNNCIFKNNSANQHGGTIYNYQGTSTIIHSTNSIYINNQNTNNNSGSMIYNQTGNNPSLFFNGNYFFSEAESNSLVYGNFTGSNNSFYISNATNILEYRTGTTATLNIENNYWGTKSSTVIDSLIYDFYDDPNFNTPVADYTPFSMGPSPDVVGSPSSITNLAIKVDSLYQTTLADSISAGDTVYVDISGVDSDTLSKGLASVWVINLTSMDTVTKTLIETSETSGNYRGAVYTAESTDNVNDVIQGKDGEILKVVSVNDPTVYTHIFIGDARFVVTLNVPNEYSTIQSALSAAGRGDTILVQPGTYTENIFWPETNGIKLISAGDSSNTIIDGGGVSSVIYMNPQTATIDTGLHTKKLSQS